MALVNKNAAVLVKDINAENELIPKALKLIKDDEKLTDLSHNIKQLAQHDLAKRIAEEVIKLTKKAR